MDLEKLLIKEKSLLREADTDNFKNLKPPGDY
jgi:hypothetical protein